MALEQRFYTKRGIKDVELKKTMFCLDVADGGKSCIDYLSSLSALSPKRIGHSKRNNHLSIMRIVELNVSVLNKSNFACDGESDAALLF